MEALQKAPLSTELPLNFKVSKCVHFLVVDNAVQKLTLSLVTQWQQVQSTIHQFESLYYTTMELSVCANTKLICIQPCNKSKRLSSSVKLLVFVIIVDNGSPHRMYSAMRPQLLAALQPWGLIAEYILLVGHCLL